MRLIIACCFLLPVIFASAQSQQDKMALQLLNNEKDFVIAAQIHGLPYGFMQYSTDSTIGLNKNGITRLRDAWEQQKQTSFAMVWKPVVVYAGEDGLHGITSGPYYTKQGSDSVFNKGGYFFSVWERKHVNDSFRLVSDCGVRFAMEVAADESLTVMNAPNPAGAAKGNKSFNAFRKLAATSLSNAILQQGIWKHELLLSNYGMFIGVHEAINVKVLEQGASLTIEKEIDNASLHIVIGKISFATNPFPADKKMQKEGWYVQVWSKDKKQPGLLATLLSFE